MTHGASAPAPAAPSTGAPAIALIRTLGGLGVIAGLLIVVAYTATLPRITANKARVLAAAIDEVLGAPARYDTLYFVGDALTPTAPAGVDPATLEAVYLGYRADSSIIGFAVTGGLPGFSDVVRLIFGYDPRTSRVLAMKVLEQKETPGLGDKIEKDTSFVAEFRSAVAPLRGVKRGEGDDSTEIDMITGVTISSRTVIKVINTTLERVGPALAARLQEASQ
ncbi:MAG TPA: FMN-binding protein [Gemmatimonadales bacterium]|nr:FMN-binding protein [Gemmatimonadales bacterium]